jgi:leucyl-tRNA synthetase
LKEKFDVSPDIDEDSLRELALTNEGVIKALGDRTIKTVIVRAPKLVNIVPN